MSATTRVFGASAVRDGLLLGAGTFQSLRVPPPMRVDRHSGAVAVVTAPVWGAAIGLLAGAGTAALWWLAQWSGNAGAATATLTGAVAVSLLAWFTRGLHLDGLGDTADGFGSGRFGADALAIMRDSRVGAFGVVTVVLCLAVEVLAVGAIVDRQGAQVVPVLVAVGMLARAPLGWLVRRGTPAADDGLGRTVVGAVPTRWAVAAGALWTSVAGVLLVLAGVAWLGVVAAVGVAWLVAVALRRRAVARFGALTGDVLGAAIEISAAAALLLLAVLG